MKTLGWFSASLLLLSAVSAWPGDEDNNKPDRTRMPAAVSNAVVQILPEWQITEVDRDDGLYEVKLQGEEGKAFIKVSEDGQVHGIYQNMRPENAPRRVRGALDKAFPDARVKEAGKRTRIEVTYVFEVERRGRKREVKINADGKILEVERK